MVNVPSLVYLQRVGDNSLSSGELDYIDVTLYLANNKSIMSYIEQSGYIRFLGLDLADSVMCIQVVNVYQTLITTDCEPLAFGSISHLID